MVLCNVGLAAAPAGSGQETYARLHTSAEQERSVLSVDERARMRRNYLRYTPKKVHTFVHASSLAAALARSVPPVGKPSIEPADEGRLGPASRCPAPSYRRCRKEKRKSCCLSRSTTRSHIMLDGQMASSVPENNKMGPLMRSTGMTARPGAWRS